MLQQTAQRLKGLPMQGCIAVCGEEHRFVVAEQLNAASMDGDISILLEPEGRDTAPAIAAAALEASKIYGAEAILLVLPTDHLIADVAGFQRAIKLGAEQAALGQLVTFGIVPTRPATGFGYIHAGPSESEVKPLLEFVEKPDRQRAEEYLTAGSFLWNSGMFMFRAQDFLKRLQALAPDINQAVEQSHADARRDVDFVRLEAKAFKASPKDSIDYAVMEKTDSAVVIPLGVGWSDLGSWGAVAEACGPDANGNVEQGDVLGMDNRDCLLRSEHRLVAAIGLQDQVVIETADAVLVASKNELQKVKTLVQKLKAGTRDEVSNLPRVHRPWGSYETIADGSRFQVKRIIVKPGERLSLQMHHHRAEHWVVVQGTAEVQCNDETILLSENQSTYIPLGAKHRLTNPGTIDLELIEIQSGAYLGEDDIVRYDDNYGRSKN